MVQAARRERDLRDCPDFVAPVRLEPLVAPGECRMRATDGFADTRLPRGAEILEPVFPR